MDLLRRTRKLLRRRPPRTRVATLRRKLRAHNLQVLAILLLSIIGSAILWLGGYFLGYWIILVLLTIAQGTEARMWERYTDAYLIAAIFVFCAAWVERRLRTDLRPPDKKALPIILLDFLFAPARMLLSLRDNLAAWQTLSDSDLQQAVAFIDRVREARRFPVHAAPVEIPDDQTRERIVFALLHLRILEMFRDDRTAFLRCLARPTADALPSTNPALP